ncbi:unnamed protein product [Lactuca saligna]|uniref:Uncharacterized protein n=1 Tax=Lactuca saligna TaxID=75948 RepID=A0AA36EF80_LACSI|nr:unnamed protein product [Lactuca saligna]
MEIENERVAKRINKLEDDLEKLKRGVFNVFEAARCQLRGVIEDVEKEPLEESLGKVVGKPMKKHGTPVKKDATPLKEEIESSKKENGTGNMVDKEEGNGT